MEPVVLLTEDVEATWAVAKRVANLLRAGDVMILSGSLGAGKTTFTQGLARALGVQDEVLSPTFVLVRTHACPGRGFELVHVDAYRLTGPEEIDQLDLESSLEGAVTVVEWGLGRVEHLSESVLYLQIDQPTGSGQRGGADAGCRRLTFTGVGPRWQGVDWGTLPGGGARFAGEEQP